MASPGTGDAWQAYFPSTSEYSSVQSVVGDAAGNVIAGGIRDGEGDFIGFATVVKLAPDGALLWRATVGHRGSWATRVLLDPAGDVIVGGKAHAADEDDTGQPLVVKLDSATGEVLWRHFVKRSFHIDGEVRVDPQGDVFLDFWTWTDATQETGVHVCRKLSGRDGKILWQHEDVGFLAAIDAHGDVLLGPCPITTKLSGVDGHELWHASPPISACAYQLRWPLTVDPSDDVIVAVSDAVVKLSGSDGSVAWQRRLHAQGATDVAAVRTDEAGDVVVAGSASREASSSDVLVAKLAGSDGRRRWQRRFDGLASNNPFHFYRRQQEGGDGLAIDAHGDVVVAARFDRPERADAVIKIGGRHGRRLFVQPVEGRIVDVTVDALGRIVLAGSRLEVINEWHDLATGWWIASFTSAADLTPPLRY